MGAAHANARVAPKAMEAQMPVVRRFKMVDGELVDCGVFQRRPIGAPPPLKVFYNDSYNQGCPIDATVRERHYAEHVKDLRKTGGKTKDRTMRHIASIPAEHYWKEQVESGNGKIDKGRLTDNTELKKFVKKNDYHVAPKDSF